MRAAPDEVDPGCRRRGRREPRPLPPRPPASPPPSGPSRRIRPRPRCACRSRVASLSPCDAVGVEGHGRVDPYAGELGVGFRSTEEGADRYRPRSASDVARLVAALPSTHTRTRRRRNMPRFITALSLDPMNRTAFERSRARWREVMFITQHGPGRVNVASALPTLLLRRSAPPARSSAETNRMH